ncbi:MAG: GlsB/YeaQ/YmgE family stress response membrane protein [Actinomycetota bacterium]|nr:GlsB/YeaQ/YmgE family stress response membrane protein [Actinomycetota bacterium]
MDLLDWIIAGLVVGVVARFLLPGHDPIGCLGTILLGVIGIYAGGILWKELFGRDPGVPWIGSIVVAMVLLAVFRRLTYRRYNWRRYARYR